VSEPSNGPIPYRVVYSERVRNEFKELVAKAKERGLGDQVIAAMKTLDERLHISPRFGDPLCDLSFGSAQLRIGTIPPLVVRYILDEKERLVMIVTPVLSLPRSGF
jgi:hypothetical protein